MLDYWQFLVYNQLLLMMMGYYAFSGFLCKPMKSTISVVNVFSQAQNVPKICGGVIVNLWSHLQW